MLHVTSFPLISTGPASDKKIGTIIDAIPTPNYIFIKILTPVTILPIIRTATVGLAAMITAPEMNRISAMSKVGFLPTLSAKGPATKLPIAAPRVAIDTIVCSINAF